MRPQRLTERPRVALSIDPLAAVPPVPRRSPSFTGTKLLVVLPFLLIGLILGNLMLHSVVHENNSVKRNVRSKPVDHSSRVSHSVEHNISLPDGPFPLPPTGGSVHYTTTDSTGWNNQRETAMVAWIISYLTGHAFEHKAFHPAYTGAAIDRGGYKQGDLWDLSYLSKYVRLKNISYEVTSEHYEYKFGVDSVFETPAQVAELKKYQTVSYSGGWSFLQHSFPWLDPWKEPGKVVFQRMMESFTYNQQIQQVADKVVQQIGDEFIALHIRKNRAPALDCRELGRGVIMKHQTMYKKGGCFGIDWKDVMSRLFPENTLPVYVAHDGSFSKSAIAGALQSSDFSFLRSLRPAIISAIEQEIAIRASQFVSSTHSSWSEYVIYKRASSKEDGRKNYKIWLWNLDILDPRPEISVA